MVESNVMILQNLRKIQLKLNAPKGQYNSFGNYKYRNCEDILTALKPLLKETNTTLIITDEMIMLGDRYYVKAIARLYFESQEISTVGYARESETKKGMDESQITGAASSYARKYALNGLFCIDDTKDSDVTNSEPANSNVQFKGKPMATPKTPTTTDKLKYYCSGASCGKEISEKIVKYSTDKYGEVLCMPCQKTHEENLNKQENAAK